MQKMSLMVLIVLSTLAVGLLFSACGGGSSTDDSANKVAQVIIDRGSILFTESGQHQTLSAKAYNSAGVELDAPITWSSSNPANISIDSTGEIVSVASVGSATIIAGADDVESAPLIGVIAVLADPDTIIVGDAQVVGLDLVDPDASLDEDTQYQVTLTDIDVPEVGDLILSTEEAPVYGRVVEVVTTTGSEVIVTLSIPPVDEMFAELDINETIDLSEIEPVIPDSVAALYDTEEQTDGTLLYSLKDQVTIQNALYFQPAGILDSFNKIFECEGDMSVLTIDAMPVTMTLKPDLDFIFAYHSGDKEFDARIKGSVEATAAMTPTFDFTSEAKITCKSRLFTQPIPVFGALSWLVGPSVVLGYGFEVGGKVTSIGKIGVEIKGTVGGTFEAGFTCPSDGDCYSVSSSDSKLEGSAKLVLPDLANQGADLRVESWAYGYALAELDVGVSEWIRRWMPTAVQDNLDFKVFEAKLGPKTSFNLGTITGQILDTGYKSTYGDDIEFVFGSTSDTEAAFKYFKDKLLININVLKLEFKATLPLSGSPALDEATTGTSLFNIGDKVIFNVDLNPSSIYYPSAFYNVGEIRIYEKDDISSGVYESRLLTSVTAQSGQLDFSLEWTADFAGEVDENIYAFVVTNALPSLDTSFWDGLGALELGELDVVTRVLSEVVIIPAEVSIVVGETAAFTAMAKYDDGSETDITEDGEAFWTQGPSFTSDITGEYDVTVTYQGETAVAKVTVTEVAPENPLTEIKINPTETTLELGEEANFTATAIFEDGTETDITDDGETVWDPADSFSSQTAGEYQVTVTYQGMSASAVVTVNAVSTRSLDWTSYQSCGEVSEPEYGYKWSISLYQDGSDVTGNIYFHDCPGGGRVSYALSGTAAVDADIFILNGTKNGGQGGLYSSTPASAQFTVGMEYSPNPNYAP